MRYIIYIILLFIASTIIVYSLYDEKTIQYRASNNMDNFIEQAKENFDVILFDTPPLIAVTDAFILMKYMKKEE